MLRWIQGRTPRHVDAWSTEMALTTQKPRRCCSHRAGLDARWRRPAASSSHRRVAPSGAQANPIAGPVLRPDLSAYQAKSIRNICCCGVMLCPAPPCAVAATSIRVPTPGTIPRSERSRSISPTPEPVLCGAFALGALRGGPRSPNRLAGSLQVGRDLLALSGRSEASPDALLTDQAISGRNCVGGVMNTSFRQITDDRMIKFRNAQSSPSHFFLHRPNVLRMPSVQDRLPRFRMRSTYAPIFQSLS